MSDQLIKVKFAFPKEAKISMKPPNEIIISITDSIASIKKYLKNVSKNIIIKLKRI